MIFGNDVDLLRDVANAHRHEILAAKERILQRQVETMGEDDDLEREWLLGTLERLRLVRGRAGAKRPNVTRAVAEYVEELGAAGSLDEILDPDRRRTHIDRFMARLDLRYGRGDENRDTVERAFRREIAKLEKNSPRRSNGSSP